MIIGKLATVLLSGANKWILIAVAVATVLIGTYRAGYNSASDNCEEEKLAALNARLEYEAIVAKENLELNRKLAGMLREARENTRVEVREVIKYVESHPNLAGCKLDSDGLRIWNGETNQD